MRSLTFTVGRLLLHFSSPGEKIPCHGPPGASRHQQAVVRKLEFNIPAVEFPVRRKNGFAQLWGKVPWKEAGQRDTLVGVLQFGKGPTNLVFPHWEECVDASHAYVYLVLIHWKSAFFFSFFPLFYLFLTEEKHSWEWDQVIAEPARVCFLYGDGKHCAGMQRYIFNCLLYQKKNICV